MPHLADVCRVCVRTAAGVWTGLPAVSCASVRRGSTRSRIARWPPAVSPDSPSSPSEASGRGSTSPSPSREFFLSSAPESFAICVVVGVAPWRKKYTWSNFSNVRLEKNQPNKNKLKEILQVYWTKGFPDKVSRKTAIYISHYQQSKSLKHHCWSWHPAFVTVKLCPLLPPLSQNTDQTEKKTGLLYPGCVGKF